MATMDEYFKKDEVYKNQSGSTVKIDWYDKNGEVQYTHNKQSQSATEKGLKNMLERNEYKKVNDIAMEYDPIMCMMVPKKAEDAKTWVVEYEDALGDNHKKTFIDKTAVEKFIRRGTDVGRAYHLKVNGKPVKNESTWTADAKDQKTVDANTISETAKAYVKDAERLYNAAKRAKEDFFSTRDEYANRIRTYWVRNKQNMTSEEEEACKSAISKLNGMSYF